MAHPPPVAPPRNRLLAALPPEALARLLPRLSPVALSTRQVLYPPDAPIDAAYFPESGMVSMLANLDEGAQVEVGVVGCEGVLGTPLLAGAETSFAECMVQLPGTALRMGAGAFRAELEANPPLRALLLRYGEALQAQVMQTAACNGRHGLEQRLARWLLVARDRAEGDELPLTQDFVAMMLGVHRPSVTVTAGILQRAGLIRYANGHITLLDRPGLEAAACECHGAVRQRFAALLGQAAS